MTRREPLQHGFTLIELSVTLVLLGLLATATALRLQGVGRLVEIEDAIERIGAMDQHARQLARASGRGGQLVYDLGRNAIRHVDAQSQADLSKPLILPEWLRLDAIRLDAERDIVSGQIAIAISAEGTSWAEALPGAGGGRHFRGFRGGYAVRVKHDGLDGGYVWLVVAGIGGQVTVVQSDDQVQRLFEMLNAPTRDDAA